MIQVRKISQKISSEILRLKNLDQKFAILPFYFKFHPHRHHQAFVPDAVHFFNNLNKASAKTRLVAWNPTDVDSIHFIGEQHDFYRNFSLSKIYDLIFCDQLLFIPFLKLPQKTSGQKLSKWCLISRTRRFFSIFFTKFLSESSFLPSFLTFF